MPSTLIHGLGTNNLPLPLRVDASGNLLVGGISLTGDVTIDSVTIDNGPGNPVPVTGTVALGAGTNAIGKLTTLPGLDIPGHDYISLTYTGSDITGVVYKTGGSGGTTVATLTLAYTDGKLTSVTRS